MCGTDKHSGHTAGEMCEEFAVTLGIMDLFKSKMFRFTI